MVVLSLVSCAQNKGKNDYLVLFSDQEEIEFGYKDPHGKVIIPLGKYEMCFTDTIRDYGIVIHNSKFVAIDRDEKVLYEVFPFDNGPDYPSEGLFRILGNGKIGYADEKTGKIVIEAQYDCALPFEEGKARVTNDCEKRKEGEYTAWDSESWFYIDKKGKKLR